MIFTIHLEQTARRFRGRAENYMNMDLQRIRATSMANNL